jgi:hypothetical protein
MLYLLQMRKIQTAAVLAVVLIGQLAGLTHAATATETPPAGPLNITIAPYAQDIVTAPGKSVTTSFQVRNNGLQTEHLKAVVKTFKSAGQAGIPQLLDPKPTDDYVKWVNLPRPTFDVEPNVWETFTVTINPPKTAAFGYYYAIDFSRSNQAKSTTGNTFLTSVDGLILLDVKAPGEVRQASLTEFSTPNKLVEFLPENFNIIMKNTGNIHVAPKGNIFIYKGKTALGFVQVNEAGGNILPDSSRKFTTQWKDGSPAYKTVVSRTKDGKPTDKTSLDWNNFSMNKLRFGKYTAEVEMIYNNGQYDVPMTAKLNFWVIPWRIIAVIAIIVLLILAGLYALIIRPMRGRMGRGQRGNGRFR